MPAGYALVPITPTQAMCQAGQWKAKEWPKFPLRISPIYQAMIAEAPPAAPPSPAVERDERAAFEAFAKRRYGLSFVTRSPTNADWYVNGCASDAWHSWQARAALEGEKP